uniref:Plastid lipid-associated protein/fibrillin conserved domain-containing protein n=1 Tax=Hemiselmis tepida TaxID=464990 RepID=A0A7S0W0K2_9CRYP|mmetsp:Transcript_35494/g.90691  ORF Transcript_35494/g.90691 Transcript_35494/m.90691 type:complete len:256 (+) Transcript_35494:44-811(+)
MLRSILLLAVLTAPTRAFLAPSLPAGNVGARAPASSAACASRVSRTAGVSSARMVASAEELASFRSDATADIRKMVEAGRLAGLKQDLLLLSDEAKRGLKSPEGSELHTKIVEIVEELEKFNPTPNPLESSDINGEWTLRWTTSRSIIGAGKPFFLRPDSKRPILQTIDVPTLTAKNVDPRKFLWKKYENSVNAELKPLSDSKVAVQFVKFNLFNEKISIKAPERAKGELDTTFLSPTLRISRGDRGNLFVLTKE